MPDLLLTQNLYATPHRFLWHAPTRTAILSDLHLGLEDQLAGAGLYLPDLTTPWLQPAWDALLAYSPAHIIIAGDLFDSPTPSPKALAVAQNLFAQLPAPPRCRLTLIPGNHDPSPKSLAELLPDCAFQPLLTLQHAAILHGHDLAPLSTLTTPPALLIVGHQHPAVTLSTPVQSAKMTCYALATLPRPHPRLLILPAFSPSTLGNDLPNPRHWLLPIPRPSDRNIDIYGIVESNAARLRTAPPQVLHFGPLAAL